MSRRAHQHVTPILAEINPKYSLRLLNAPADKSRTGRVAVASISERFDPNFRRRRGYA